MWAGELMHLTRDLREDRLCTCGQPASSCDFWQCVVAALGGEAGLKEIDRTAWRDWRIGGEPAPAARVVEAVAHVAGAHTVVDTSKPLGRVLRILAAGSVQVALVWMRREPAAVAARHVARQGVVSEQQAASRTGLVVRDVLTEVGWTRLSRRWPVLRVDIDVLALEPHEPLRQLADVTGLPLEALLEVSRGPLRAAHVLTANRVRLETTVLRPDPVPSLPPTWRATAMTMAGLRWGVGLR